MIKSGLGKGLEALFPSNVDISKLGENVSRETNQVVELKINEIEPNVNQPRKKFDDDKINDLAESIKNHGVIQPIIVTKKDNYYQIIAGERRWRASKKAGLKTVPAIIKNYDERKIREVSLIENIQRQDLNAIEAAKAIKELMEEHSLTQDQLSKTLGKSRSAIANSLRILNLDERVQGFVEEGKLSEGHARSLASVDSPQKQYKLALDIINMELSVRDAETITKDEKKASKKKTTVKKNSKFEAIYKDLENKLKRYFGTKVLFKPNKDKGKIIIEYYSNEELDRILDLIKK
jgi:ParB family chromosome partitioning protein